ncbi:hypothetical protein N431DRAFT_504334 [Stipitochalara longipes BDJ]|nr:hypothetical protein N431DRAFT_504334 [Stipitochalara longipes BDJ]
MTKLIDLPSEVLQEICLFILLVSSSDIFSEYPLSDAPPDLGLDDRVSLFSTYSNSKTLTNSFLSDISAQHRCQGTPVDEIYEPITRHRCSRKSLLALSLTCKRLHEIAEPSMWTMVEMDQESEGSIGDLVRILNTVTKRLELGRHVKALAFRHFYVSNDFPSSFTSTEEHEMSRILEWDSTHQVAALLDTLPNLHAIKLSVELIPEYFHVFEPSTIYLSGFPIGLQKLTEFSFHWEDPDGDAFSAAILLPLFLLPNLKTLYLGHPMAAAEELDNDFHDITRYYYTSNITSLIIDFGNVEVLAINAYLKLPKKLERFEYSYGGGTNRCGNAEVGEYFRALLPQKSSLKVLKIRGCRDMQSYEDERAPNPAILKWFTELKEFACPVRLLLFRDEVDSEQNYKLEEALPPNVEKVILFAYDDWSFDKLNNEIKDFFSFGKRKFPALREMRVECWLKPSDYDLHVQRGETTEDAIAVMNSRIEGLKIRGRDKGVDLDFEIDSLSKSVIWTTS